MTELILSHPISTRDSRMKPRIAILHTEKPAPLRVENWPSNHVNAKQNVNQRHFGVPIECFVEFSRCRRLSLYQPHVTPHFYPGLSFSDISPKIKDETTKRCGRFSEVPARAIVAPFSLYSPFLSLPLLAFFPLLCFAAGASTCVRPVKMVNLFKRMRRLKEVRSVSSFSAAEAGICSVCLISERCE